MRVAFTAGNGTLSSMQVESHALPSLMSISAIRAQENVSIPALGSGASLHSPTRQFELPQLTPKHNGGRKNHHGGYEENAVGLTSDDRSHVGLNASKRPRFSGVDDVIAVAE